MAMRCTAQAKGIGAVLAEDMAAGRNDGSLIERSSTFQMIATQQKIHIAWTRRLQSQRS